MYLDNGSVSFDFKVFGVRNQIKIKQMILGSNIFIELDDPAWPRWASFDATLQLIRKM